MLTLNQLKNIYKSSPVWMQKSYASIPVDIRNGKEYRKWKRFLQENIDIEEYQIFKLKETLEYAYNYVPYYKKIFDSLDATPKDINSLKELELFPLLTKKIIEENYDSLQAKNYPNSKRYFARTGGTTGHPTKFYQSKNIWKKEMAFVMDYFAKHEYTHGMLKASFKGGDFESSTTSKYWSYDYFNNDIIFSPIHLNDDTIKFYVEELNKKQPLFFHTYPSSLLLLIDLMKSHNLRLEYKILTVFLVSEGYDLEDINIIKEFFECNVSSFYGHTERIVFAPSIDDSLSIYKPDKRYGLFELVDDNDKQMIEKETMGTIVSTSFDNYAMPLIRYKTDDLTMYVDDEKSKINKIDSLRHKIYLDAKDNQKINITFMSISALCEAMYSFQFYQEKPGTLKLLIVPKKEFTAEDKIRIEKALHSKISYMMDTSVKLIDKPIRTNRGKSINVIKNY